MTRIGISLLVLFISLTSFHQEERYEIQMVSLQEEEIVYMCPRIFDNGLIFSSNAPIDSSNVKSYNPFRLYHSKIIGGPLLDDPIKIEVNYEFYFYDITGTSGQQTTDPNNLYFNQAYKGFDKYGDIKEAIVKGKLEENRLTECEKVYFCLSRHNYIHPTLSENSLNMIFISDVKGGFQLFETSRKNVNEIWSKPVEVKAINWDFHGYDIFSPNFIGDRLLTFSVKHPEGLGGFDIYKSYKKMGDGQNL